MGLRQMWRDYRTVKRELRPRKLVPAVIRDVRAGRLGVGQVLGTSVSVWLDLDNEPRRRDPIDEHKDETRTRLGPQGPGLF